MAEKKFGVRDLEIIDPTGTPTIESSGDLIVNAGGAIERLRIGSAGQIGLGGTNYGSSGQVLTSNGSGSAPTWQTGGASEAFKTIVVSGQSDVVADSASDTLTLEAGSNMTITTSAGGDKITFASSGGGGGGVTTGKAIAMAMIFG